jgi:UDP-N-acetylglucosamine diphosphorylase/glucosamine-1-phosphate N-acetyltransferase
MSNLVVTIMAGGEGKRMNSNIPKILHKFNSIPMLVRIIIESFKLQPHKIIVITGKYHELIKKTIDEYFLQESDILKYITYVKQLIPNGTGDAIKSTLEYYNDNDNVLILNGDMPLVSHNLLEKFILSKSVAKLLVSKLDNPYGYGRIIYDNNGKFIGIKEEKDCTIDEKHINIINVGIYFFSSNILKKYIPLIDNNNIQKEYYLTDIVKLINKLSDIYIETYQIEDNLKYQIMGVNTQEELKKLEETYESLYK